MFTGIIKLAQIDDYISPSQNCIQPKIMKPTKQEQKKATVSLNDCLACSGCITSAQSILIEQMSLKKFRELVDTQQQQNQEVIIIISPQSLLSLSRYYKIDAQLLYRKISAFFMKNFKNVKQVHNLSLGIKICHELIYKEYLQKQTKQQTVLCSQCPGWICYAQKTLNLQITQFMSEIKSPQQILSRIIKESSKKQQSGNKKYPKVVSIMPCYDKKLQAIRFQLESSVKQLDLTLTTTQIVDLLKEFPQNCLQQIQIQNPIQKDLKQSILQQVSFLKDQTSNGYIQILLERLKASDIQIKQIKNSDFIQYSAISPQGKQIKMAKCYGFRNIQKIVQTIKKKKCPYSYVQIMACPGGCYSGGGQIRYADTKQKQISQDFKKISKECAKQNGEMSKQVQTICDLGLQDRFKVVYKPIQKTLTQSVMNW